MTKETSNNWTNLGQWARQEEGEAGPEAPEQDVKKDVKQDFTKGVKSDDDAHERFMRLKAQWARREKKGDETEQKEPAPPRMQTATKGMVGSSEDGLDKKLPSADSATAKKAVSFESAQQAKQGDLEEGGVEPPPQSSTHTEEDAYLKQAFTKRMDDLSEDGFDKKMPSVDTATVEKAVPFEASQQAKQGDPEAREEPPSSSTRAGEVTYPGAFHVGGEADETDEMTVEESVVESKSGDPIAAELVDPDVERQMVEKQVQMSIAKERASVPVAEVVHERFCCQRRTMIAMLVLALLAILGILLGVFIDPGEPPQPVPDEEEIVEILSAVSSDGGVAFQTPGSAQNKAFHWLANDTFTGYHSDEKLIQRYALATIYYATNGEAWLNNSLWLDNGDECGRWWQFIGGFSCDSPTGGITSLGLSKNNLNGTLPPEVGLLSSLEGLGLSQNYLKSMIPTEIGQLTALEGLNIKGSHLQGSIPEEVADISMLKSVNLAENELSGSFVVRVGKMTSLVELFLQDNNLSSMLPDGISKLSNLKNLNLNRNSLSGLIPPGIGQLKILTEVHLHENQFSGSLPSHLGLLTMLTRLNLSDNKFKGPIPPGLINLTGLKSLYLNENELTGFIPSQISKLTNLEKINLRSNKLTGSIPSEIGRLFKLTSLYLYANELTSTMPSEISELTNLVKINLRDNDLSGEIPNLGKIIPLEELDLRSNSLNGTIPADIPNLINMRVLSLRENNIGGTIPNGIGLMTALELMQLRENLFVSSIPSEVGLLTALTDLNIRDNKMTGDIPSELYGLLNLKSLNIGNTALERGNAFRGSIPTSVALMTNLEGFLLHNIQLYGTIPSVIGRLTNLRALWLQSNALTGEIPSEILDIEKLEELFLYNNNLTGAFSCPVSVEKCLVSCNDLLIDSCRIL